VRDVPVAAQNHLAAGPHQPVEVRHERVEKPKLGRLAMRPARSRRQIDADDGKIREVRLQIASFDVEFRVAETGGDARRRLGIQRHSAISLARGRVERRVRVPRGAKRARHVTVRALDFLQAHDVPRLGARKPPREPLAFGRAQAVDVERDDAHAVPRKKRGSLPRAILGAHELS
jgi:hypothetical protein